MTVIDHPQELAWDQGETQTVALMGTINAAVAQLVATIRMLIDTDGWHGSGIQSVEHWVTWKAAVARGRARGLVQIARRVPAERDGEMARRVPTLLISQLDRALACCPPHPDQDPNPRPKLGPDRHLQLDTIEEGWLRGSFCLPPDEGAVLQTGLSAARDAEFRDRQGLEPHAELDDVPEHLRRQGVSWADALVRMAFEAADALDATLARTGCRGDRNKVILHIDVEPDGSMGPGQLHLGPTVPDTVSRYLSCDAEVMVAAYRAGQLIGITPTVRTVNRNMRRVIERRDQGCAHPLCMQKRWLHIHHIAYWEHRGLTVPSNLICLCPTHHRALHAGDFTIEGNPDTGTVRFYDARGRPIEPPGTGPPRPPDLHEPSPFRPPDGERLSTLWFSWN